MGWKTTDTTRWAKTIEIFDKIVQKKRVLIVAHGNSLRALVKHLDSVLDEDIVTLNIPTGIPLVYEIDDTLHVQCHYYLGDEEKIKNATATVEAQVKSTTDIP